MKAFELRISFPTGTILVGGHSALPARASAAHARDHEGRPFIPATALRGALRENLEALLRGAGRSICDSGTGLDPEAIAPLGVLPEPTACVLDAGQRCICCRVFGTRAASLASGARVFSSLILGDASLEGEAAVEWLNRQHVSVSRSHRSAESERLFLRRTPALHGRTLRAQGYTVEAEFDTYFEAAVRATKHLGSGRSVGLSRVELELVWRDEVEAATRARADAEDEEGTEDFTIRVTLQSPTALGGPVLGANYRPTRDEIPGSTLRGAVGFAIARTLSDPDADQSFQTLVAESGGADFGFLYPVEPGARPEDGLSAPWPLTARACKVHHHEHGVIDTLFDRIAAASIECVEQVEAVRLAALPACSRMSERDGKSASCGAPLRSAPGFRAAARAPKRRVVTRASIERRSSSIREGALFSYELLEPGAMFEGTIRNVPPGTHELLARALKLPVHLGRGASSGWGKAKIELISRGKPQLSTLEDRGAAFTAKLEAHFNAVGLPTAKLDTFVPVTFLAPFLPAEGDEDGVETLAQKLGGVQAWPTVARRFIRDGGWDQRRGCPVPELAVAAGAVYVAQLDRSWRDPTVLLALRTLERTGVGRRRHQGYGHLIVFDPFILTRKQDSHE